MKEFIKTFPYETCKDCTKTYGKSRICKNCDGNNNFDEIYNADPNCVHEIYNCRSGGIKCRKCNGWFCF